MADRSSLFAFKTSVSGLDRVKAMLKTAQTATGVMLGKDVVAKKILKMQKDRFKPAGTNKRAQRGPDGRYWRRLSDNTKRLVNTNRQQKLRDTGTLVNAIYLAKSELNKAIKFNAGAAIIAVRHTPNAIEGRTRSKTRYADEYGALHQSGTKNMPARQFLGVNKSDAKEIERYMTDTLNKFFVNFS